MVNKKNCDYIQRNVSTAFIKQTCVHAIHEYEEDEREMQNRKEGICNILFRVLIEEGFFIKDVHLHRTSSLISANEIRSGNLSRSSIYEFHSPKH
jgi:hypothetical protein